MISVLTWKWKPLHGGPEFGPEYVNRMRSMLARHLHLPHTVFCITDDERGIDPRVRCVSMPGDLRGTPRCRRRMRQYSAAYGAQFGSRLLSLDLDEVIVDDITPIVNRSEPICMWRVGYAKVLSGSFVLWDNGALDGAWRAYHANQESFPKRAQPGGIGSDQAMLNLWLRESRTRVAEWTERDGFVTFFGTGYEEKAHLGVGPSSARLPAGARVVVLGSDDKAVMDEGRLPWIKQHWN